MDSFTYSVVWVAILSALATGSFSGFIALCLFFSKLRKSGKLETKKGVYTWTPKEDKQ